MNHELWFGNEGAFTELARAQKWASESMIQLMDRKSFLDIGEDEEDAQPGDHLISYAENGVPIVSIKGSLTNAHEWWHPFVAGKVTSYEALGNALRRLAGEEGFDTIVLDISSGGGAAMGVDNITQTIREVRNSKRIVAHTSTAAFSAAYWIASSTDEVVATRMAEVGSIGTLMVHQSFARMAQEVGIDFTVFRAGKYKALGLPYEELSEEAQEVLQKDLEKANSFFLEHVSKSRNLSLASKDVWAEGKNFYAEEGVGVGLVDRIASLGEMVSASGAASTHQRRKPMFISDDKRAQIAAGAEPEDVLTADELTQYHAELNEPAPSQSEEEGNEEGGGPSAEEEGGGPAADEGTGFGEGITAQDYRQALKDAAKAEARAEQAEEKVSQLQETLNNKESQLGSVTEIGKQAVHNLQTALGKPKESASTPEGLVTMFNELRTEMSQKFPTGRKSQEPKEESQQVNVPLPFRNLQSRQ